MIKGSRILYVGQLVIVEHESSDNFLCISFLQFWLPSPVRLLWLMFIFCSHILVFVFSFQSKHGDQCHGKFYSWNRSKVHRRFSFLPQNSTTSLDYFLSIYISNFIKLLEHVLRHQTLFKLMSNNYRWG